MATCPSLKAKLPDFLVRAGIEPAIFRSLVRRPNHSAIQAAPTTVSLSSSQLSFTSCQLQSLSSAGLINSEFTEQPHHPGNGTVTHNGTAHPVTNSEENTQDDHYMGNGMDLKTKAANQEEEFFDEEEEYMEDEDEGVYGHERGSGGKLKLPKKLAALVFGRQPKH